MNEEVYTSILRAGSRTYFFHVRKSSTGKLYIDLNESKKISDGTYERHSVMVFEEDIRNFVKEINEVYKKFFVEVSPISED